MKTLLATILFTISINVSAMTDSAPKIQYCSSLADFAGIVMEVRQAGVPKDYLRSRLEATDKVLDSVIDIAYSAPIRSTEELKQQITENFETNMFVYCLEANSDGT